MINWVFLDIGNVLVIDEPLSGFRWEMIYERAKALGHQISFRDLMKRREDLVLKDHDGAPHVSLALELLGKVGWDGIQERISYELQRDFMSHHIVAPEADSVLQALSDIYNVGMAANQPKFAFRQAMEQAGLLNYFTFVGISDEMGLKKPDQRFFKAVFSGAGCQASDAIMVGDRVDNDIGPAQALGMWTIWFNLNPESQGYTARSDVEEMYIESLRRAPSRGPGPENKNVEPDSTITELSQLTAEVEKLVDASK